MKEWLYGYRMVLRVLVVYQASYGRSLAYKNCLPPNSPERSASFFGLSLPSKCRGQFQISSRKLLSLQTTNKDLIHSDLIMKVNQAIHYILYMSQ